MELTFSIIIGAYTFVLILITFKYFNDMKKWYGLLKVAYATILRPLVSEKVADTESEIDDFVLNLLDKLFDYEL